MMRVPNKKQIFFRGSLFLQRNIVPIFCQPNEFGKNANSAGWSGAGILFNLFFVWRQLGFAFFGALTPVGAPFAYKLYFKEIRL